MGASRKFANQFWTNWGVYDPAMANLESLYDHIKSESYR